jgi:hypothetical protein
MIKAKDFWFFLCEKKDFRFFSGVACPGFNLLYKAMNPDIMHYIPAAHETLALSMASGISLTGVKSGILISSCFLNNITFCLDRLNKEYMIPVLLLVYLEDNSPLPKGIKSFSFSSDDFEAIVEKALSALDRRIAPVIICFKEGDIV